MRDIVETVAKAIETALVSGSASVGDERLREIARAAIDAYKSEIAKTVPPVEYFEGCRVDQLDETAYRRYLAYKRDPQNHLRMAMGQP